MSLVSLLTMKVKPNLYRSKVSFWHTDICISAGRTFTFPNRPEAVTYVIRTLQILTYLNKLSGYKRDHHHHIIILIITSSSSA